MFGKTGFGTGSFGGPSVELQPIDSSRWTGLPTEYELSEARRQKLQSLVDQAFRDLDLLGAGNAEKAQARSYLVALNALSEAPDPPTKLIWMLIERGMAIVGVCEIFYKIAEALIN